MLRSSRHPYQGTTVSQNQPPLPVRNPWIDVTEPMIHSTLPSRGARARTGPPPASEWLLPRQQQSMSHHGPLLNQQVHPVIVSSHGSHGPGSVAVSTVHGSSTAVSVAGGIDSCGGQCVACETFCYYCLQVLFIAGILTGVSLTIAGSVLRGNHRGGDLMVLVYIGVLLALVCILLLSVHCCVRKNVKERKRALRLARIQTQRHSVHQTNEFTAMPMQDFINDAAPPDPCLETNLDEYGYVDNPRHVMNVIPNPSFRSHNRSAVASSRSSMSRSHSHDRRFHLERPSHDWDRQPYQPMVHRPNR